MSGSSDEESDKAEGASHPRHASRLYGHVEQERALLEAYKTDRLPHAIIIGGATGIGKATLAWRLAKFILSHPVPSAAEVQRAGSFDLPGPTRASAQAESLSHPDLTLLRRAFNEKSKRFYTEIRADDVRRAIGLFQRAAGAGGYRVCIVDSAEDLNRSSANALLKIIEEPPPYSLFILVAHRPGQILPTIRSRSRLVRLNPLDPLEVAKTILSLGPPWSDLGESAINEAAARAQGSVREALRLLGQHGIEIIARVSHLLEALPDLRWKEVHKLAETVAGREGERAYEIALTTTFDWLSARVQEGTASDPRSPARLAPWAEVWEKIAQSARETDALNLDRRPLILSIFSDLAAAVRATSA